MGIDDGHDTRTILLSSNPPGFIIINRGSKDNISPAASNISDGQAMIKAFSLSSPLSTSSPPPGGWDFKTEGILLGWGLRNNVGLAQHPTTGGIWSVENSADELNRSGTDVHLNNPGDELNYLGTIKAPSGGNYGYPTCFAAWNVSALPENEGIRVGEQFAMDPKEDWKCKASVGPRLTFQAHVVSIYFFDDTFIFWFWKGLGLRFMKGSTRYEIRPIPKLLLGRYRSMDIFPWFMES